SYHGNAKNLSQVTITKELSFLFNRSGRLGNAASSDVHVTHCTGDSRSGVSCRKVKTRPESKAVHDSSEQRDIPRLSHQRAEDNASL
ncbi:hypothetical protein MYX78_01170, partial [Acidobacteria bacterium AH-259-G07]|nr:hypothetical protein [Acidobacteria bacterium AH-259-G07]